jgi:hypothetical protein
MCGRDSEKSGFERREAARGKVVMRDSIWAESSSSGVKTVRDSASETGWRIESRAEAAGAMARRKPTVV